jgi:hypothetical protein
MEYFLANKHISASIWFTNSIEHELILRKMITWDLKGHNMYQPLKDLNMTILK